MKKLMAITTLTLIFFAGASTALAKTDYMGNTVNVYEYPDNHHDTTCEINRYDDNGTQKRIFRKLFNFGWNLYARGYANIPFVVAGPEAPEYIANIRILGRDGRIGVRIKNQGQYSKTFWGTSDNLRFRFSLPAQDGFNTVVIICNRDQ